MLAYLLTSTIAAYYGHCGPYGACVIVDLDFDKVTVPRMCVEYLLEKVATHAAVIIKLICIMHSVK